MELMDPREIQELEQLCVQDEAPFCEAACPLHVDARAMLTALAAGNFARAAQTYAKRVPLPRILSRICDEPCRAACKREEAGGGLSIQLLERSCAEAAGFAGDRPRPAPARRERVAIVGGGLSGLAATAELVRRGYRVTLFEAGGDLGRRLRDLPGEILAGSCIDEEVSLLKDAGVHVMTNIRAGRDVTLAKLREEYDAVYLGVGAGADFGAEEGADGTGPGAAGAAVDDPEAALIGAARTADPVTLATALEGVFAGGSARRPDQTYSPVMSVADGSRAAISIDRFLKQESLAPRREREGPYETTLYTSLEGVEPAPPVIPGQPPGYSEAEAVREAARCLRCECLECVKACTYLEHFNEYPGKCIRKVTKNIMSVPGKSYRTFTKFINACSLCGLCGVVCPTDLDMAVVNSQARAIMIEKGFMPPAIHDFALRDMASSNNSPYGFARHQPGHSESGYLFFPGCQLAASAPLNVERTYRHLTERLSGGVGLMLRCCGAPALWSGRRDVFAATREEFLGRWEGLGRPAVILACPTCSLMFGAEMPEVPAVSLWEVLREQGLPEVAPAGRGRTVAVHDSCTARFAPSIQDAARDLLSDLGYSLEELPYSREITKCCGYGGLMQQVNPALADKVVASRVSESPTDYVTYCSNCRDLFAAGGKTSYHLLDLIFAGHPGDAPPRPGPTPSQRRENRRYLAKKFLSELWGETIVEEAPHLALHLTISPEVETKLEGDRILREDLQQVIHRAETTGDKLCLQTSGHFIAHYQPGIITYWVEYAPTDEGFEVFNAYSHRMKIVKRSGGNAS